MIVAHGREELENNSRQSALPERDYRLQSLVCLRQFGTASEHKAWVANVSRNPLSRPEQ